MHFRCSFAARSPPVCRGTPHIRGVRSSSSATTRAWTSRYRRPHRLPSNSAQDVPDRLVRELTNPRGEKYAPPPLTAAECTASSHTPRNPRTQPCPSTSSSCSTRGSASASLLYAPPRSDAVPHRKSGGGGTTSARTHTSRKPTPPPTARWCRASRWAPASSGSRRRG